MDPDLETLSQVRNAGPLTRILMTEDSIHGDKHMERCQKTKLSTDTSHSVNEP